MFENLKILVVEDQQEMRTLVRNMLAESGVTQIFEAADGREALQFMDMAYDCINLIICDWNMPGVSGLDLVRQIRTTDTAIPVLMLTGRHDKTSVLEAKMAGVTAYIGKPFSEEQLASKLRVIHEKMRHMGRL